MTQRTKRSKRPVPSRFDGELHTLLAPGAERLPAGPTQRDRVRRLLRSIPGLTTAERLAGGGRCATKVL